MFPDGLCLHPQDLVVGIPVMSSTSILWFRRDLRLSDNPAWNAATTEHEEVVCLFIIDPAIWDRSHPRRQAMLIGNLKALDGSLQKLGGRLRLEYGEPTQVISQVTRESGSESVYVNADVTPFSTHRDMRVGAEVPLTSLWGNYLHPIGSITTAAGAPFQVFTPFFRAWFGQQPPSPSGSDQGSARLAGNPGSSYPESDPPPFEPGQEAASQRLAEFDSRADSYSDDRDRPDFDSNSKLSVDLKFGTISPAAIVATIGDGTEGRRDFVRQLAWREFYAQLLLSDPDSIRQSLRLEYRQVDWVNDGDQLAAWKEARTGFPIIDAGMRQLLATGLMHNRVRMLTASFLVKDLLTDWRFGERFFRYHLLDADTAQNVGNWQWVAGTGADAAPYFRIFNPVTQSRRFDPTGAYIRRWVPELSGLSDDLIHTPWEAGPLELSSAAVELGVTYPFPIVDHSVQRELALAMYRGENPT